MSKKSIAGIALFGIAMTLVALLVLDLPVHAATLGTQLWLWSRVTLLGSSGWMLIGALVLLVVFVVLKQKRGRNAALLVLGSVALSGIAVQVLKAAFGRARPPLFDQVGAYAFQPFNFDSMYTSMPSGHATSAFAFGVAVALIQPALRGPATLFALFVAFSRLPLGVHYLSDIIAGATLGGCSALLLASSMSRLGLEYRPK